MSQRPRRSLFDSYKSETVALIEQSGKSIAQVARQLNLNETDMRQWVEQAKQGASVVPLTLSERAEIGDRSATL